MKEQILHNSIYEVSRTGKFTGTESRTEVTRGWERGGNRSYSLMRTDFVWGDEKILKMER